MTHLPYIVASYALVLGGALALALDAAFRLRRARTRLALMEAKSRRTAP